jgi:hypothetical protein
MEETRQHTALTSAQMVFGAVWLAGPLLLFIGILAALAVGNVGIALGMIGQAASRVATAVWALAQPDAQIRKSPTWWRLTAAALWSAFAFAIAQREF